MNRFLTALVVGLLLVAPGVSHASIFQAGEVEVLSSSDVIEENVYLAGASVVVNSEVIGDVFAAGSSVSMSLPVWGDLFAAGADLSVQSDVDGDVRVAGGNVRIGGQINGELIVAGGLVQLLPDAVVTGDVIIAGGEVYLNGQVNGDVLVYAEQLTQTGEVGGNENVYVSRGLTIAEGANIQGDLTYKAPSELDLTKRVAGEMIYEGMLSQADKLHGELKIIGAPFAFFVMMKWLSYLFLALVAVWALPKFTRERATAQLHHFWKHAFMGFVVVVVTPVLAGILMLIGVGMIASMALMLCLALLAIVAGVQSCLSFGAWFRKIVSRQQSIKMDWLTAVIGALVFGIIAIIPVVGWVFALVWWLSAMGELFTYKQKEFKRLQD